jgi:Protein of Unknown function (DUF2784)
VSSECRSPNGSTDEEARTDSAANNSPPAFERWIDRILFYDVPTWVFTAAYLSFAALVVITWIAVPPTRFSRKR